MEKIRNGIIYLLVFLIAAIAGIIVFDRYAMGLFVRHGQSKPIPDLTGMKINDARKSAEKMGFRIRIYNEEHNPDVPDEHVISQIPKAGSMAKRGRSIKLTKSLGYEMIDVPIIRGIGLREAQIKLNSAKLVVNNIIEEFSDSIPKDLVITSTPESGSRVLAWSKVDLVISMGAREKLVTVPNFVGMEVEDIEKMQEDLDLIVIFKHRRIPSIQANTVYEQSIEPGSFVERTTEITLLVSQGNE